MFLRGRLKQEMEQSYNDSLESENEFPEPVNELEIEHLSLSVSGIKGQIVIASSSFSDQFLEYMTQSNFESVVEEFDFEGNEEL